MRFSVQHGAVRLRIVVLPTVRDVHKKFHEGVNRRDGTAVHSFFNFTGRERDSGTIYFAAGSNFAEYVPHEVGHALIHHFAVVHHEDDEKFCTFLGILSARVLRKLGVVQ